MYMYTRAMLLLELVEEIYSAQRQRDDAMLSRLRSANEERDAALVKLQHISSNLQQYVFVCLSTDDLIQPSDLLLR